MSAPSRAVGLTVAALVVLALRAITIAAEPADIPPVEDAEDESDAQPNAAEIPEVPPVRPPVIQAPLLPTQPAPGKGRLNLVLGGDRTWCANRDDRVVQPPPEISLKPSRRTVYDPIYTYGYQFTIAAVARARPAETILLFESPVIRTTYLRLASKLGRGGQQPPQPMKVYSDSKKKRAGLVFDKPTSIVPFWQESFACTTLPEVFDFDLDPGAYDIYMAFDILGRSGGWAHRSIGFLTDVVVEEQRHTRLEGRVDHGGGGRREVELQSSALLPVAEAGAVETP